MKEKSVIPYLRGEGRIRFFPREREERAHHLQVGKKVPFDRAKKGEGKTLSREEGEGKQPLRAGEKEHRLKREGKRKTVKGSVELVLKDERVLDPPEDWEERGKRSRESERER